MKSYTITEEQIKENQDLTLKEYFKEVFETKYEPNNWFIYLNEDEEETLVFVKDNNTCYGFDSPNGWSNAEKWSWFDLGWIERKATKEEVEQALIKEAERRGFKEGVTIKKVNGHIDKADYGRFSYCLSINQLAFMGHEIFKDGIWAEIIEEKKEMTIEEIEKELGYSIKIVKDETK